MKLTDPQVRAALKGVACFTGEEALKQFANFLDCVTRREFVEFEFLLKTAKNFGVLVLFAHGDDDSETGWVSEVLACPEKFDRTTTGLYRPWDNWVEVVVGRLHGWGKVEYVLRHELVHVLQQVTSKLENESENLVTDHLTYGAELAAEFRSKPVEGDPQEAEAYGVCAETKFVRAWSHEILGRALYAGWTRPTLTEEKRLLELQDGKATAAKRVSGKVQRLECYVANEALRDSGTYVTDDGWTLTKKGTVKNPRGQGLEATKGTTVFEFAGVWGSETVARCLNAARQVHNREQT